jgi:aminopeptidase N
MIEENAGREERDNKVIKKFERMRFLSRTSFEMTKFGRTFAALNFMKQIPILIFLIFGTLSYSQQTENVDFLRIGANLQTKATENKISGGLTVKFRILKDVDSIFMDANMMTITDTLSTGPNISTTDDKIWIVDSFKAGNEYDVAFFYEASPKQALYFTGDQIWTQGQGKYTSHWLPSLDDMNDKIEFDFTINSKSNQTVIANGKLESVVVSGNGNQKNWRYNMDEPMASYLVALVIGDFRKKEISATSGVPIELYYKAEDSLKVEPTYRYTKEIFDFLEKEIGVPYPWQNYKQVPVRDFLYAGMENTTATVFSEAFVVDSIGYNDRNYVNINAHELAHHWFGNLVTEMSGTHHWLQEGFATYYAHLAEKQLFGEDYYYWMLYQSAEQLGELSNNGKGESLLNSKASSLTFYEKGAWALHILRELIGEEAFRIALRNYLEKHKFENVDSDDFLVEVRAASNVNISQWEKDWLRQSAFKAEQAYNSLKKSSFMQQYFQISALRATPLSEKMDALSAAIEGNNDFIGQEAVYQLAGEDKFLTHFLYEKALQSDNLYIRQAVAASMDGISEKIKEKFEGLLQDPSYLTIEAALSQLWESYPKDRARYLDVTKDVVGFQDKNVRQLWLALASLTEGYRAEENSAFISELQKYSSSEYSFEIRQISLRYIHALGLYNDDVIDNLIDATVHHNWRFRNSSRRLFSQILLNPGTSAAINSRMDQFSEKEQQYLNLKLNTE